ncbi:MAG TPA: hypothetical protein VIM74_03685, partial [Casimicrobiaceae bacterium]
AEIVTVAANLDTDDWTRIHGYSPLAGSLNPTLMPPLPPTIAQLHYVGGRDRNVPPSVVQSFARRHAEARVIELADFDHECCWIERWPKLLEEVASMMEHSGGVSGRFGGPRIFKGPSAVKLGPRDLLSIPHSGRTFPNPSSAISSPTSWWTAAAAQHPDLGRRLSVHPESDSLAPRSNHHPRQACAVCAPRPAPLPGSAR